MDHLWQRLVGALGLALFSGGLGLIGAAGVTSAQQPGGSAGQASRSAPADQQVLEAGDVHLGNSRVYVHVGKTGLGHEHGVMVLEEWPDPMGCSRG